MVACSHLRLLTLSEVIMQNNVTPRQEGQPFSAPNNDDMAHVEIPESAFSNYVVTRQGSNKIASVESRDEECKADFCIRRLD